MVVIGSPMCTMFSQLQNIRRISEEGDLKFEEKLKQATMHVEFCVQIYKHRQLWEVLSARASADGDILATRCDEEI